MAIVDEFPHDAADKVKSGGLLFDRRLTRVVSPGTLITESFIEPWENNYLLCIHAQQNADCDSPAGNGTLRETEAEPFDIGLAWVDLASGEFNTEKTSIDSLSSVVSRICPREIIVDPALEADNDLRVVALLKEERRAITFHKFEDVSKTHDDLSGKSEVAEPSFNFDKLSQLEKMSAEILINYVDTRLQGKKINLQPPVQRTEADYMVIDKHSVKALELRATMAENLFEGSLLHSIRKTVTKSGARLLLQRLLSPSTSLGEVNERLDLVTEMIENDVLHEQMVDLLRQSYDSLRLVQKFAFGKGYADDLLELSKTIKVTMQIAELLDENQKELRDISTSAGEIPSRGSCLLSLLNRLNLDGPNALCERISKAIDEDSVSEQHRIEDTEAAGLVELADQVLMQAGEESLKGIPKAIKSKVGENGIKAEASSSEIWIMRKDASRALSQLHNALVELNATKAELEQSLRTKSGAASLTLRWASGKGHYCHIKGKDTKKISFSALGITRHAGSSKSTTSFYVSEWTSLGSKIDSAIAHIRAEEQKVFATLRESVVKNLVFLRRNARVLDELDVACSFAIIAKQRRWTRPVLNHSTKHCIVGGRHPMVEDGLTQQGQSFTSNDCMVGSVLESPMSVSSRPTGSQDEQILLITGPNMAGKSTYLRQNALISILAQTGSYVPAEYCSLGIVDAVYSRVGSADNLYLSQSTFMLEMMETAHILRHATPRSFVIMDEVGRGTTPEDGIAVSYAALWHLYHRNKSRTLFATHFHDVADMVADWKGVGCWCTDIAEDGNGGSSVHGWAFVHKLTRGVNRRSHALKVAQMAGMPEEAIQAATKCLDGMHAEKPATASSRLESLSIDADDEAESAIDLTLHEPKAAASSSSG